MVSKWTRTGPPVGEADQPYRPHEPGTLLEVTTHPGVAAYSNPNPSRLTRESAPHLSHHLPRPMAIVGPGERFLVIGSTSDGLRWWLAVVLAQTGTVGWVADRPMVALGSQFPACWKVLG